MREIARKNGRDVSGRFAKGNAGGPGNLHARQEPEFRATLLRSVTKADVRPIVKTMVERVKAGEPWLVRERQDRTIGKPPNGLEPLTCGLQNRCGGEAYLPLAQGLGAATTGSVSSAVSNAGVSADLAAVVDAWPTLPEHVRQTILTLIRASGPAD